MWGKISVAIGVLALLLAGCSAETTTRPSPTATPTDSGGAKLIEDTPTPTASATSSLSTDDVLFLALVRGKAQKMELADDETVIALGKAICGDYDSGMTTQQIGAQMVASGRGDTLDSELAAAVAQAGYIIGVSTSTYCPEHDGK